MLQWLPENNLIFNDYDENHSICSKVINVSGKLIGQYDIPIKYKQKQ